MKKIISLLLTAALLTGLSACGAGKNATGTDATGTDATGTDAVAEKEGVSTTDTLAIRKEEAENAVVVYFSHNDVIKEAAEFAASTRNFDLIEIVPKKAYPDDPAELARRIEEEQEKGVHPALKDQPESLADYDIIFLGFPVWNGTIPRAVATFLEDYDMVDKALIPFCYAADGEVGESLNDIASICRYSAIISVYMIPDGDFRNTEPILEGWMDQVLFG
ncbi:MAG: hypothetical protein IJK98_03495 [Clostridia bacterium]|nr:hypothetical protein [Clostridia bacterium]